MGNADTGPGRAGAAALRATAACRRCTLPVAVLGDPEWGKAVHADTGQELGPDGHLAAPTAPSITGALPGQKAGTSP